MEPETQLDKVMDLIANSRDLSERIFGLLDDRHPKSSQWANTTAIANFGQEILHQIMYEQHGPLPSIAAIAIGFYSLGFIDCQKYGIPDELGQIIMDK